MGRPHDRYCCHLGSPRFERSPVLSSSYRNRLARPAEEEEPPPPPPDLIVTGTLNPDATGQYFEAGTHHGHPYYARDDDAYLIWYSDQSEPMFFIWIISTAIEYPPTPGWLKLTFSYEPAPGVYEPPAPPAGVATIAEP